MQAHDYAIWKSLILEDADNIKHHPNPSESLCLLAVREHAAALQYIRNQTDVICLAAVREDGMVLQYVQHQTPEICLAAVQEDGRALQHVQQQSPEICLAAVQHRELAKAQFSQLWLCRCCRWFSAREELWAVCKTCGSSAKGEGGEQSEMQRPRIICALALCLCVSLLCFSPFGLCGPVCVSLCLGCQLKMWVALAILRDNLQLVHLEKATQRPVAALSVRLLARPFGFCEAAKAAKACIAHCLVAVGCGPCINEVLASL